MLEHVQLNVRQGALTIAGAGGEVLASIDTGTFAVTLA